MSTKADIFSRNTLVWGEEKQKILSEATILIAGAGGLGCFVSELLVRNGVKKIVLVDYDRVDTSDLNRQILYTSQDIGKSKVETAAEKLTAIHHFSEVIPAQYDIHESQKLGQLIKQHQVQGFADCLDNYSSRFALESLLTPEKFLVHGGVQADYGQVTTIRSDSLNKLADLFANTEDGKSPLPVCVQVVACIGAMMVQEILNNLWGQPQLLNNLQIIELSDFTFSRIQLR